MSRPKWPIFVGMAGLGIGMALSILDHKGAEDANAPSQAQLEIYGQERMESHQRTALAAVRSKYLPAASISGKWNADVYVPSEYNQSFWEHEGVSQPRCESPLDRPQALDNQYNCWMVEYWGRGVPGYSLYWFVDITSQENPTVVPISPTIIKLFTSTPAGTPP